MRFAISITERYSRHSVGKEFSLGLLEYENTRPMYDINEVNFVICYLRFNLSIPVQQQVGDSVRSDAGKRREFPPEPRGGHHDSSSRQFQDK